ncbi:MAG: hypothetical protein HY906_21660 [Deltaproteobacteria bacterium]|nr:hypothetical protein [Deltaproteobacteria bacterium]
MRKGKRVTSTLGLLLAAVGAVGLATAACEPNHDPNREGPPSVVKVFAFSLDDPTVNSTLFVTDDPAVMSKCDYDYDGGAGPMDAYVASTWGFRIVLSELVEGDEIEPLSDGGVGEAAYPGFVQITTPTGGTVTSALDPTMQLTPDMLFSTYQPAGSNGCYGTVEGEDISAGGPLHGPAILTFLDGVSSLPASTALTLWLKKDNGGHQIVDTGGTPMAADFKVDFTTDPMLVDCPAIDACQTMPSVNPDDQPQVPDDPDLGFDTVTVQFNTPIGDPTGVYLYDAADLTQPVPDVVPDVDANIPDSLWGGMDNAVTLTMGIDPDTEAYIGIAFTPGATYWIVVTSDVLDLWGVPAEVTDVADANGDPLDTCGDLAAAGITVDNCIWAGTFTVADAT